MRKRVLTGTILGLVLFALGSAAMDRLLQRLVGQYQSLIELFLPLREKVDEMHLLLLQQQSIVERSTVEAEMPLEELERASNGFDQALSACLTVCYAMLENPASGIATASAELVHQLREIDREYREHSRQVASLFDVLAGLPPEQRQRAQSTISRTAADATALQDSVAAFEETLARHYDDALDKASFMRSSVRRSFVGVVAAAIALGTLANVFFYRSLLPLKSMVEAVRAVARGRYEVQVPVTGGDEVAFLAGEFNTMARALTEQRRAIERSQEVIRATFDGIHDALVVHDEHGSVLHANPAAHELALLNGSQIPGCYLEMLGLGGTCPGTLSADGDERSPLVTVITDSDTGSSYEVNCQRVADDAGKVRFVVEFVRDITEKLNLERIVRQSEKLTAIGELSLGVAHEVRNPLSTIQMTLHALGRRTDLNRAEGERVELALHEVNRLEALVSSLLDYGRKSTPQVTTVDVQSLLARSIELVATESTRCAVAVVLEPPADDLPAIEADHNQLLQVLVNLLLNAIQASPSGERVVAGARSDRARRSRETVVIRIADNGSGIGPQELKQIFTPFFTTRREGTGLGLPVARTIVEAHGGELAVDSALGRGTTVHLTLPVRRPELNSPPR